MNGQKVRPQRDYTCDVTEDTDSDDEASYSYFSGNAHHRIQKEEVYCRTSRTLAVEVEEREKIIMHFRKMSTLKFYKHIQLMIAVIKQQLEVQLLIEIQGNRQFRDRVLNRCAKTSPALKKVNTEQESTS
ncbi:hypothetical protein DPMN_123729 [Dreissena polymorpha]|uniref:Uncharacterized protein n=1 Tax=Dreissena polymorpha TaxID=45954 RepID=A0A9D4JRT1_DREPO|nr:hypothetical protein DPMN_123729 [Dreissena polymorpha]